MRISDWSSDVCSSDLCASNMAIRSRRSRSTARRPRARRARASPSAPRPTRSRMSPSSISKSSSTAIASSPSYSGVRIKLVDARHAEHETHDLYYEGGIGAFVRYLDRNKTALLPDPIAISSERSEEHTSELQSLMRISYAVF